MTNKINAGACLVRSWNLYKSEFGLIFFTTLVITIASSVANGFPYIGPLIGLALNGVLHGGLYLFYLKLIRGQKAELPDAFDGFRIALAPLVVASLITGILIVVAVLIAALPMLFTVLPVVFQFARDPQLAPDILLTALGVGTIVNIVICLLIAIALYLLWIFTFPLVIDKRLNFWPVMEASRKAVLSNLGPMIGLFAAGILLAILGVLACCIGVFFTLPVFFGAIAYAYEDLFSPPGES